jgi:hypothetical protein
MAKPSPLSSPVTRVSALLTVTAASPPLLGLIALRTATGIAWKKLDY